MTLVKDFSVSAPKTKELVAKLADLGVGENTLILLDEYKTKVCLAARNLPYVDVLDTREMPPEDAKQPANAVKADFLDDLAKTMVAARRALSDSDRRHRPGR